MISTGDNWDDRDQRTQAATGAGGDVTLLVNAGLPLESGLRALSEEAPSRRLQRALARMGNELAAGESVEVVLSRSDRGMPRYVRGLVKAGVQSGQLGGFLEEFLVTVRRRRTSRQRFLLALMYPLLLLPAVMLGCGLLVSMIVPDFRQIFDDFGVELPYLTILLLQVGGLLSWQMLAYPALLLIAGLLVLQVIPWLIGPAVWTRMVQRVPVIGTAARMRGMSEFCSFLGLLVSGRIPLPDALDITAEALQDANLRSGSRKLAARVAGGESLREGADRLGNFPLELRTLFRWENRDVAFGQILRQSGEVFAVRSQVHHGLSAIIFQPLLLTVVAIMLGLTVVALYLPLIRLLSALS
jgi:type II secretory pathway component PulF